MMYVEV
jgi:hypothetical protein